MATSIIGTSGFISPIPAAAEDPPLFLLAFRHRRSKVDRMRPLQKKNTTTGSPSCIVAHLSSKVKLSKEHSGARTSTLKEKNEM